MRKVKKTENNQDEEEKSKSQEKEKKKALKRLRKERILTVVYLIKSEDLEREMSSKNSN